MILGKEIEVGKFYRYDHDKTYFILAVSLKQIVGDRSVVTWLTRDGIFSESQISLYGQYHLEPLC